MTTIDHPPVDTSEGLRIVGDVTVGFPASRTGYGQQTYGNTEPQTERATWLHIRPDGGATVFAGKVEYGQNIRTGLAIEVADELRLPLDRIEVILGDTDLVPWDMGTFGSQSTARVGVQLRRAAATARETLLNLAADRLDLPVDHLEASDGLVIPEGDPSRAVSYADLLAGQSLDRELDADAPVLPSSDFHLMGTEVSERIDAVARVTGRALYSQDIQPEGVLFASVIRPVAYGARARSVDFSVAAALPGVVETIHEGSIIAVIAESDEQADRAAGLVEIDWDVPSGQPAGWELPSVLVESGTDGFVMQESGDLDEGFRAASEVIESTYFIPYIAPIPMEPRAAVAEWRDDRLTVWAGTQRPFGIRQELAEAFDIHEERVRVIAPEIGGGFGAKSPYRPAIEAAKLARAAGRPVRVAYTRVDESVWSNFRPAAVIRLKSGFTSDGRLTAWQADAYHSGERVMIGRRGSETPYTAPHVRSTVYRSDSPLPSGSYRSLGAAVNHFAREVHMDEIAAATGIDPVELRLLNLTEPRFRRALEATADLFGWANYTPAPGRSAGIAIGIDVGSYVATATEVSISGSDVRVHRVAAALDCGLVVNPEGARNQMEGAIIMGIGGALFEAADFEGGRVLNSCFARYRVPRITDTPSIDVRFVGDDTAPSTGAGEPGIVPIGAAISNAVFGLTGQRHRELPIQRHL
ncbi:MAG: molybdopterin-dependent oxidoreductase [Chloroflexi bacterium]|nr:molybdopterin-dependent oxidoreductase [Chloroflexota bacterium]MDA1145883.1 molybdopterin-dependent oxidoreductase [Chloroflexota bacterium]